MSDDAVASSEAAAFFLAEPTAKAWLKAESPCQQSVYYSMY